MQATIPYHLEKELAYRLLGVLQAYAPTSEAQQKCADMYNDMSRDATPREMVLTVANSISDGLQHGNWPWTEPPTMMDVAIRGAGRMSDQEAARKGTL